MKTMKPYRDVNLRREALRVGRETGYIWPPEDYCAGEPGDFPCLEDFAELMIPRSQWRDHYEATVSAGGQPTFLPTITYDQNGYGTCTANACSQAMAYQWVRQFGKANAITPAPPSLYPFCASSGQSGSAVSCIVRRATDVGVLLIDNQQNRSVLGKLGMDESHVIDAVQWDAGRRVPSSWYDQTARHFRIVETYSLSTTEAMFSAVLRGFTIVYGRSGHAICGCWCEPTGSTWILLYHNSWGPWGRTIDGLRGFGEDSESYLSRTGAPRGAVAVRTVTEPAGALELLQQAAA